MAIVRSLVRITLERESRHLEAPCTYAIVHGDDGRACLQIDTYGSSERKILGKKSQSIRFSPEAAAQLRGILAQL